MGMTVPLSGFICNALDLKRQQQKLKVALSSLLKNIQGSIHQLVVRPVICTKIEQYIAH